MVFSQSFGVENTTIKTYGNTLSGQYNWVGMAAEELSREELDFHHPRYTTIIGIKAVKNKIKYSRQEKLGRGPKNPEVVGGFY